MRKIQRTGQRHKKYMKQKETEKKRKKIIKRVFSDCKKMNFDLLDQSG